MWVQKMKKEVKGWAIFLYFALVISFHGLMIFTNIGNYFHGSGVVGWILLQINALLIVIMAVRLIRVMERIGKFLVFLGGVVPTIFLLGSTLFFLRGRMG